MSLTPKNRFAEKNNYPKNYPRKLFLKKQAPIEIQLDFKQIFSQLWLIYIYIYIYISRYKLSQFFLKISNSKTSI